MPELPDIELYRSALAERVLGRRLERIDIGNPFLLRSVAPPLSVADGRRVVALRRLGKRIAIGLDGNLWLVLHLMIAGRLSWQARARAARSRRLLAQFVFESGVLGLTEAGAKRRASLYLVEGDAALAAHDPGGLEPLAASADAFAARLRARNHTVKRALTDPRILSGIGNAYSDEILHAARLSPFAQTHTLDDDAMLGLW